MHRRKRIRKQLIRSRGAAMDIDSTGVVDHSKPLKPSNKINEPTNIEQLSTQLRKITIKSLADEQKKIRKPKYIDTSKLLRFHRQTTPSD
jgi:hypothetical protein